MKVIHFLVSVWQFYRDGFRNMTWGRTLWFVIIIKLFIIFVVLRIFFFHPALSGMNDKEKQNKVGENLIQQIK